MNPIPSWLSNIINLLAPIALVIGLAVGSVSPDETEETADLLEMFLENFWAVGALLVVEVKAIIDSFKRWGQDNPEGSVASAFGIEKP